MRFFKVKKIVDRAGESDNDFLDPVAMPYSVYFISFEFIQPLIQD
jgi:hypothetical protein